MINSPLGTKIPPRIGDNVRLSGCSFEGVISFIGKNYITVVNEKLGVKNHAKFYQQVSHYVMTA